MDGVADMNTAQPYAFRMLRIVCGIIVCGARWLSIMRSGYVTRFGERIRQLRERSGLSQEILADAAGLHRTHISLIERGHRSIRIETIERLAIALDVEPSELMPPLTRLQRV